MMHISPSFFGCQVHRFNLTAVSYDYQLTPLLLPPYQDNKKQYFHRRDLKKRYKIVLKLISMLIEKGRGFGSWCRVIKFFKHS